jgi:hypothetical protein
MSKAIIQASVIRAAGTLSIPSNAQITIRDPLGALATLYETREGTGSPGNPITADANGFFAVYADSGRYSITVSASGYSQTYDDVVVIDELGTSAFLNVGDQIGDVVGLEDVGGIAGLPAVDGSQLSGVPTSSGLTYSPIVPISDADVTLIQSEYESGRLVLADGAWTANHNIIVPDESRRYYIDNTAGTYTATVKTAAGTGIPIPAGVNAVLVCDGSNVIDPRNGDSPSTLPHALVSNSAGQSVPNATDTVQTFDTVVSDGSSLWDAGNNQWAIPHAAVVSVSSNTRFLSNTTGTRAIRIAVNGSAIAGCPSDIVETSSVATALNRGVSVSGLIVAAGDTIKSVLRQSSGGALSTQGLAGYEWFSLRIEKWL